MVLDFEVDKAYVTFTPEEGITAKEYLIKVFAKNTSNNGSPTLVYTSKSYTIQPNENKWHIIIDLAFYNKVAKKITVAGKPLPNIIDFSFKVVIDNEENEVSNAFSIHFVRYMPKIFNALGYTNAEKLQRIWFTEGNNTDKDSVDPKIDLVSFEWALGESSQVNTEYNQFLVETGSKLNDNYFLLGNNIRNSLKSEINKMINDGIVTLPTASNTKEPFGVTGKQIITQRGEKIPEYEKYYFESKSFSGNLDLGIHFLVDGLDDFIASIANFVYHIFATGFLEYKSGWFGDSIVINVKQFGVYIKDRYDFEDEPGEASQPLGYWKINDDNSVEVERTTSNVEAYFEVTNKSYTDYRNAHSMGYDYYLYSTVKMSTANYKVKLTDV